MRLRYTTQLNSTHMIDIGDNYAQKYFSWFDECDFMLSKQSFLFV